MTDVDKKDSSKNKTKTKILDVSARMFSRQGYNGTVLRDIANELDMKAGSLYYHFESKEQLVLEVLNIGLQNITDKVIEAVDALPEDATSRERLFAAAKGHLTALLEKGDYTSTSIRNLGLLPDSVQKEVIIYRKKYENLWRKWIEDAQVKGDIRADINIKVLRLSIFGALNRTVAWYKEGELSINEIAEIQMGFLWDGIS